LVRVKTSTWFQWLREERRSSSGFLSGFTEYTTSVIPSAVVPEGAAASHTAFW
jgi:hypothetical protein